MKIRGAVYNGDDSQPGLDAGIVLFNTTSGVVKSVAVGERGEWEIEVPGNPGDANRLFLFFKGRSREMFIGERDLGFGPAWSKYWPATLGMFVSGTSTVRNGVVAGGFDITPTGSQLVVGAGTAIMPGMRTSAQDFWVASFQSSTTLDFAGYNVTTQEYEEYSFPNDSAWILGVEHIPSTDQSFLTLGQWSGTTVETPNGSYANGTTGYNNDFVPIAAITRSGPSVSSLTDLRHSLGEGRSSNLPPIIATISNTALQTLTTGGTTLSATSQVVSAARTDRVLFRGDAILSRVDFAQWTRELTVGSFGTGTGNFSSPEQVAVDSSGNIYVADSGNDRLLKLNSSGVYQSQISSLDNVKGVAIDASNNIYVTFTSGGSTATRKYNSSLVQQWERLGDGTSLAYITTDSTNYYVVDAGTNRVFVRRCSDGNPVGVIGSFGSGNGQFTGAYGITTDGTYIYVTDVSLHRVQKFTVAGTYTAKWGSSGSGDDHYSFPRGIAVDESGNVWVADAGNTRAKKTSNTGTYLDQFAQSGRGIIAVDDETIWMGSVTFHQLFKWVMTDSTISTDWENIRLVPDVSINGSWQSLDFGNTTNGALYQTGWTNSAIPTMQPFRGVSASSITVASGDTLGFRVVAKTTSGTCVVLGIQGSFQLLDMGAW